MKYLAAMMFLTALFSMVELDAQQCGRVRIIRQTRAHSKYISPETFENILYPIDPSEYEAILYGDQIDKLTAEIEELSKVKSDANDRRIARAEKRLDEYSERACKDLIRRYNNINGFIDTYSRNRSTSNYQALKRAMEEHLDFVKGFEDRVVRFIQRDIKDMESELKKSNLPKEKAEELKNDIELAKVVLEERREKAKEIHATRVQIDHSITNVINNARKESRNRN